MLLLEHNIKKKHKKQADTTAASINIRNKTKDISVIYFEVMILTLAYRFIG